MKMLSTRRGVVVAILLGVLCTLQVEAQDPDKEIVRRDRTIDNLIRSIDDIVWSNIVIYEMKGDFLNQLVQSMQKEDSTDIQELAKIGEAVAPEPLASFSTNAMAIARNANNAELFKRQICSRYSEFDCEYDFDAELLGQAFSIARTIVNNQNNRPKNFYIVTSRGMDNPRLIALLGINLESGSPMLTSFRRVGSQMYDYLASNNNGDMYGELKEAITTGSPDLVNQMFVLRDLEDIQIIERSRVLATYIDEEQYPFVLRSISSERPLREPYSPPPTDDTSAAGTEEEEFSFADILGGGFGEAQEITTVVDGAAVPGAVEHPNEIVVGTDVVVGYYSYELNPEKQVNQTKWGIELINNFDEINYPSLWGGRLTLNAILRNIKIGAVLPTPRFGNSIGESGLFNKPQKILGGYGAAFGGDFAFPVINNSGLFNFHASYSFAAAETDGMIASRYENPTDSGLGNPTVFGDRAHLIRFSFEGFYSFGFYADPDAQHLFRLKLGGAVYGVDEYERRQVFRSDVPTDTMPTMEKLGSDNHGGIAARIEYMKGGTVIPYGASIQYFDGSLLNSIWLQFIVARNIDLKIQGKYFTPIFRDARPWESGPLVVPSIEVKYHFGAP